MRLLRCQRGSVNQAESASRLGKGKVHPGAGLRSAARRVGRHAGGRYAHKEKDFMSLKRVEPREIVSDRHFPWLLFFSNRVRVSKTPIEVARCQYAQKNWCAFHCAELFRQGF